MRVIVQANAARQVQRERVWLVTNRGWEAANAFEEELRHALELLAECPDMGDASPRSADRRHWFLRRSRFHVYYRVFRDEGVLRVAELRHEKQRPLKQ